MRPSRYEAWLLLVVTVLVTPALAPAADVPVAGRRVAIASRPTPASSHLSFTAIDGAIALPLPDPTRGASLFVFSSNGPGQCRIRADLATTNWTPTVRSGQVVAWSYVEAGSVLVGGATRKTSLRVVLKQRRDGGVLQVKAKNRFGAECSLGAGAQQEPLAVTLQMDDTRYCAAFGGEVRANQSGRLKAVNAPPPPGCVTPDDITAVTFNHLHGLFCPSATASCRLEERLDLAGRWIVARGCPDLVAFQEVTDIPALQSSATLIMQRLTGVCPFPYQVIYTRTAGLDDGLILTRYPALSQEVRFLQGGFRQVLHARIDHPAAPIDVFATHLSSGSDGAGTPCAVGCPAECLSAGAATQRDCQAVQTALFVQAAHDIDTPALVMGDFNEPPGSFVYDTLVGQGWTDTYLAAGNPECDSGTGIGCTSGRADEELTDLESPALGVNERIDYVFLVPPPPGTTCAAGLDSPLDADGDGVATRLFADEPNPFGAPCGAAPAPICWPSDHDGVQVDVNCE